MNYFEQNGNTLIYRNNGETFAIEPWGRNALRVRAGMLTDPQKSEENIALDTPEAPEEGSVIIEISEMFASLSYGKIRAELEIQAYGKTLQTTYKNSEGKVLLREISYGHSMRHQPRLYKPLPGGNFELKCSFESDPSEKIYGMGQQQLDYIDLKGCNLDLSQRNTLISIPFYVSSLGYGFLWHNAGVGTVHFGKNTTEWMMENTRLVDYWITAGDTPAEIIETFTGLTGRVPMMPEYGLGFWQCKLRYYNQEQVLSIAREYKKRNVPLDVIVIDYYHWPFCGDFRFDPEFFPDPKAMVDELHEMGVEVMVSIWPQIDFKSENYAEMKQQGLLVRNNQGHDLHFINDTSNCVFMDATNPRARAYVWDKIKKNYFDMGIKTFWLDEAEPEFGTYEYENYRYYSGPVSESGNIYPREFARMMYEGQKAAGQEDIVNLIRCAWVGSSKYAALVWSGDVFSTWEELRHQIAAGLSMGLSGIPWWTSDIGGFNWADVRDPKFHELLIRWFQFGTFCPVMRLHGNRNPHTEIYDQAGVKRRWTGADNEIWSFGEENYEIMSHYIMLRDAMRDYTRALMAEAKDSGAPVMRPLFYEFPDDEKCWDIADTYMFGPNLLVAPVLESAAVSRSVYLPEGADWTNASTKEVITGGTWYDAPADLKTIPVFLRDGKEDWILKFFE